jgi:molecular chaperone HscB
VNYYELFKIPISFEVDQKLLTQRYYALSRENHPDKYTLKSTEEQLQALQLSTEINNGFKILRDRQKRIKYLLEFLGVKFIEGADKVSQDFLMEIMDINEELMEYQFDPDPNKKAAVLKSIEAMETSLSDRITPIMAGIEFQNPDMKALADIKDYYLKSQYLGRLRVNLNH